MGNACTRESGEAQQGSPLLAALAQKDAEARAMHEELERPMEACLLVVESAVVDTKFHKLLLLST